MNPYIVVYRDKTPYLGIFHSTRSTTSENVKGGLEHLVYGRAIFK
jgi:hypothetical protein